MSSTRLLPREDPVPADTGGPQMAVFARETAAAAAAAAEVSRSSAAASSTAGPRGADVLGESPTSTATTAETPSSNCYERRSESSGARGRPSERYTVAVMGRSNVGKSAIAIRYTRDRFVQDYDPTIEDTYLKDIVLDGTPACLEILDTAGQEIYSALRRSWMQHGAGFLFVFSLVDRQTFDELTAFHDELMDLYHDDPPPSVLVANKADIDRGEWAVLPEEVVRLRANWRNCMEVVYTSARSGRNIADAFERLSVAVRERSARSRREGRERGAGPGQAGGGWKAGGPPRPRHFPTSEASICRETPTSSRGSRWAHCVRSCVLL